MHYWLKSYGDFAEWVEFSYWWSFSGGGSVINRATPSGLINGPDLTSLPTPPQMDFFFKDIMVCVTSFLQT